MQAPLVSKIRCFHPNKKKSVNHIRNLTVYIATREGVDLSPEDSSDFWKQSSEFPEAPNEVYLKYMDERPGSNGLFGNTECLDPVTLANTMASYSRSGKCIYRGLVSLTEQDAVHLGFDQKEKWSQYMHKVMPDIGNNFHIPIDKLQWTAAMHMKKGHPHVHYMFWRSDDKVQNPYIHPSLQNKCRELLSKEMFQEEHMQAVLDKTLSRDLLLDIGQNLMQSEVDYLLYGSHGKIPDYIGHKDIESISGHILNLLPHLPPNGRLAYQLLVPEIKSHVDNVVSRILEIPSVNREYQGYLNSAAQISLSYSPSASKRDQSRIRAEYDMKKRLANQILKACKTIVWEQDGILKSDHFQSVPAPIKNDEIPDIVPPVPEALPDWIEPAQTDPPQTPDKNVRTLTHTSSVKLSLEDIDSNLFQYIESDQNTIPDWMVPSQIEQYKIPDKKLWAVSYKSAVKTLYSEHPDYASAITLLKAEAANHNPLALHDLGRIYEKGLGITPDPEASFYYYEQALKGLHALYHSLPDTEDNSWLRTYLQYRIGKMYQYGSGTEVNYRAAIKWYQDASVSGNHYAQYALGSMYQYGTGIEITAENKVAYHTKALRLFKASADSGNPYAAYSFAQLAKQEFPEIAEESIQHYYAAALAGFTKLLTDKQQDSVAYKIGLMKLNGYGTQKNIKEAIEYFEFAAKSNNYNAYYALGKIHSDPESEFYHLDRALECLNIAYQHDNEYAALLLGKLHSDPSCSLFDISKAITFYTFEKLSDNDFAQYKLGKIYSDENFGYLDMKKALVYYEASAKQGNEHAQYALGRIFSDQKGSYYNISAALSWLEASSGQNNSYAQLALGNIYLWGKHPEIKKDEKLGTYYLNLSIQNGNPYAADILKIYKNFSSTYAMGIAYRLVLDIFSAIAVDHRRQLAEQSFQSQTKAQMKIDAKRNAGSHGIREEKER